MVPKESQTKTSIVRYKYLYGVKQKLQMALRELKMCSKTSYEG